jgi:hypothetical protein
MPHFSIFLWETLDHLNETEEIEIAGLDLAEEILKVILADEVENLLAVAEEVSAEAEADSAVEEIEEICLNVMQFVLSVEKIVKFLLNQQVINQFIAVNVLAQVQVAEEIIIEGQKQLVLHQLQLFQ